MMGPSTLRERILGWIAGRFIYAAYRLVWIVRKLPNGRSVYKAMWDAQLDLPTAPTSQGKGQNSQQGEG